MWNYMMGRSAELPSDAEDLTLKVTEMKAILDEKKLETETKDEDLLRFLKARKGDVNAAVEQYTSTVEWRKSLGIDELLLTRDPNEETFQQFCSHCLRGHDMEGRPIYWEKTGAIDQSVFFQHFTNKQLIDRHIRRSETQVRRIQESANSLNKPITQQTLILDLSGFSVSFDPRGLTVFKETIKIDQNYYPERLGHFFFINTPWLIHPVWSLVSPFVDPVTLTKFHLLGSDYLETLKQYITLDNIPIEYGGTMEWPKSPHEGMSGYATS